MTKADDALAALAAEAQACRDCQLWKRGTQTVFGAGPASARVALVGEQPGDEEDRSGVPFVGPAGRLLDDAVDDAGLVALGATAGQSLFGPRFRVGAARGAHLDLDGHPVVATIHPSAVLRARTSEERAESYDGLVADLRRAASLAP